MGPMLGRSLRTVVALVQLLLVLTAIAVRGDCRLRALANCKCSDKVIDCSYAGLDTTEVFLSLPTEFPRAESLNVSGNRFEFLEKDLFGPTVWYLKKLDMSNCKVRGVHRQAFEKAPELEELLLSDNMLSFEGDEKLRIRPTGNFLRPIAGTLRELNLRNAFERTERQRPTFPGNFSLLLNSSSMPQLQYLTLSNNSLERLSPTLFHDMPTLQFLYLSDNRLYQLELGSDCALHLLELHLRNNAIRTLDQTFIDALQTRSTLRNVYLEGNPFACDCQLRAFVSWLRNGATMVDDKHQLTCARANPRTLVGQALVNVPEDRLQCPNDASEYLHGVYILCAIAMIGLIALLTCLIYTNRRILCKGSVGNWLPMGGYQVLGREPEVKAEMV